MTKKSSAQAQRKNKISVRLTNNQMQILGELKDRLGCSYSTMIRSMVLNFLTVYEDELEEIITGRRMITEEEIRYINSNDYGEEL